MPKPQVAMLGTFQASLDGAPVASLAASKAGTLLAYLAVEADRPHTREALATLFWPESSEEAARANLM